MFDSVLTAIKKWWTNWRKEHALKKKTLAMYARLDANAEGKFTQKSWIKMVKQMKKGMK